MQQLHPAAAWQSMRLCGNHWCHQTEYGMLPLHLGVEMQQQSALVQLTFLQLQDFGAAITCVLRFSTWLPALYCSCPLVRVETAALPRH
jgi:hypothetical protein